MTTATATTFEPSIALVAPACGPPPDHGGLVARPRLVSRLGEEPAAPLVLVAAPAGYGKTTLLGEWARCDGRPFAWLTLDEGHNDPALLVAAVEYALDEVAPREDAAHAGLATRWGAALPVLRRRLAGALGGRGPLVLVIDDLHVLRSGDSLELLRILVDTVPPGVQLALGSRTEPALPLGRLRAHRVLAEVRARDLAMTVAEACALLSMAGVEVGTHDAEALIRKTEGWPAALYLAALSLRGQPDLAGGVGRFGGDDLVVAEYLRDEVLAELAPEAVEFLMRAAILDRLSGPVCDAVLARRDSARLLREIGRRTLLLVPLDRKGESYRCSRLLVEMLGGRRRLLEPDGDPELHRRASDWYGAHGDSERATAHAIAAGDTARAGQLLWASVPSYVATGRNATMQRWLSRFTPAQIAGEAGLALAAAHSHLAMGELDAVQRWTSSARKLLHETPPKKRGRRLEAGVAILRAATASDGLVRMGKDALRAYRLEPEDSPWRAICCLLEGVSLHLTGEPDVAERRLEEGVRRATIAAPIIQTLCLAQLALLAADREDWESAAAHATRATAQCSHYRLGDYPTMALVFAVSALVHTRRGSIDEAHDDVRRAQRLLGMLTDFVPWYEIEVRLALAGALMRSGEVRDARRLIADASRAERRVPEAVVLHGWIDDAEAHAAAASGTGASVPLALTAAELRILHFLPTHLSFREIAARLYVSGNTVKTQAHSVYRKLDASSRSEAVARAAELGLIGP